MNVHLSDSWKNLLFDEFDQDYFKNLIEFVTNEYEKSVCYPEEHQIFAALNAADINEIKVVILGQDPYHGQDQANGLCFSVNDGIKHPPSLVNIFKELETDIGIPYPKSGDLSPWSKQGVLLLNATLTVRQHEAGSHQKQGWEQFTDSIIKKISENREGVIFLLWGGFAKKKVKLIDSSKHFILTSGHPSPLSANRGYWFGNKHFSKANEILKENNLKEIDWSIE